MQAQKSEVALLLAKIATEYEAAERGLVGLAATARHSFITKRMENISRYHEELRDIVGDEAMPLIVEALDSVEISAAST